jgi:hypothetical protein
MAPRSSKRQSASDVVKPLQPETAVILYNQRTGVISHTHFFSAANGGTLPGKEELERVAYAHAEKDGCNIRTHKAIHVDPATLTRGLSYRVSVKKRAPVLVEVKVGRHRPQCLHLASPNGARV